MVRRRVFVLVVTSAAAMPAWGQAIEQASSGAQGAASIPDFSGVWTKPYIGIEPPLSGPRPVKSRFPTIAVGDYTNPILKPHAAEMVKKQGEIELSGVPIPSPRNQCWPEGVPLVFRDVGMQMFQQPDKITILYDYDHEVRTGASLRSAEPGGTSLRLSPARLFVKLWLASKSGAPDSPMISVGADTGLMQLQLLPVAGPRRRSGAGHGCGRQHC
jgi:hypothetical protein